MLPGRIGKLAFGDGSAELNYMLLVSLCARGCDDTNEIVERERRENKGRVAGIAYLWPKLRQNCG